MEKATIGGGCFWCIEAVFENVKGVKTAVSGYAGGLTKNPTYEQVCSGTTGHAEVVQIEFDPATVSYERVLEIFFAAHDPTTPNRQGADVGTQYRSIILTHDERQMELARNAIAQFEPGFPSKIVTEIIPLDVFYPAEVDHQDYYRINSNAPYCKIVIAPKVKKLSEYFK